MGRIISKEEIGKRLQTLREQAGYTQEKLAEAVGITRGQIQKYEYGIDMMNTEKLQLVANALSVPVQDFFVSSDEAFPLAVEEKLLLDSYRAIHNKEIKNSILKLTTNATKHDD